MIVELGVESAPSTDVVPAKMVTASNLISVKSALMTDVKSVIFQLVCAQAVNQAISTPQDPVLVLFVPNVPTTAQYVTIPQLVKNASL